MSMKILVVDDKQQNLDAAREQLEPRGHQVVVISTIIDAYFLLLRRYSSRQDEKRTRLPNPEPLKLAWDVILTDMFMPRGEFRGEVIPLRNVAPSEVQVAAGAFIAIAAYKQAVPCLILSATDHHARESTDEGFLAQAALMDFCSKPEGKELEHSKDALIQLRECRYHHDDQGRKDWLSAGQSAFPSLPW